MHCADIAESSSVHSSQVQLVLIHCADIAEFDTVLTSLSLIHCADIAESSSVHSSQVQLVLMHCADIAESSSVHSSQVRLVLMHCADIAESSSVHSSQVRLVLIHCAGIAESSSVHSSQVRLVLIHCADIAESSSVHSSQVRLVLIHCAGIAESSSVHSSQREPHFGACSDRLVLGKDFPASPPKGYFLTKIFHPNVGPSGEICVNVLKRDWRAELGIRHILLTIRCLLIHPNPESALNPEAGRLLLEGYPAFASRARLLTEIHAIGGAEGGGPPQPKKHAGERGSRGVGGGSGKKKGGEETSATQTVRERERTGQGGPKPAPCSPTPDYCTPLLIHLNKLSVSVSTPQTGPVPLKLHSLCLLNVCFWFCSLSFGVCRCTLIPLGSASLCSHGADWLLVYDAGLFILNSRSHVQHSKPKGLQLPLALTVTASGEACWGLEFCL
ncbi:ubiquitin-conjugating enzyme E2 S [Acipenser oxyrinchus oxyrinchus]|uniref:Ubiquitin-conjugating enzyme E2 S n=1 Tax=Acipenser oxyrinchus oxyrinchus TaxID=40147 RepID=A0AAD8CHB6_ACIOX|nr:ubiquitin-conjugating enzyme E2 S [Acipenser oxyrinchus oxyrinchus]